MNPVSNSYIHEVSNIDIHSLFDIPTMQAEFNRLANLELLATKIEISESALFSNLVNRLPFMNPDIASLLNMPPYLSLELPHIDGLGSRGNSRVSAINIPLYDCSIIEAYTQFWRIKGEDHLMEERKSEYNLRYLKPEMCELAYSHNMRCVSVVNVREPHNARNASAFNRQMISFGSTLSFNETIKALEEFKI
jgi:hypothetical protein